MVAVLQRFLLVLALAFGLSAASAVVTTMTGLSGPGVSASAHADDDEAGDDDDEGGDDDGSDDDGGNDDGNGGDDDGGGSDDDGGGSDDDGGSNGGGDDDTQLPSGGVDTGLGGTAGDDSGGSLTPVLLTGLIGGSVLSAGGVFMWLRRRGLDS